MPGPKNAAAKRVKGVSARKDKPASGGRAGSPRQKGLPQQIPGGARVDIRTTPDFIALASQFPLITIPEYQVFRWLERHMGWRNTVEFQYLDYLPGVSVERGDQQVDFTTATFLAFAVDGIHWHLEQGAQQRARDLMNKWVLEGLGYTVVTLLDVDLNDRLEATMRAAMQGLEMPTVAQVGSAV